MKQNNLARFANNQRILKRPMSSNKIQSMAYSRKIIQNQYLTLQGQPIEDNS